MPAIDDLYLIASSPQCGRDPKDPEGTKLPPTENMVFFEKVQQFLPYVKIGYDWAGSSNTGGADYARDIPTWAAWFKNKKDWDDYYKNDPEMKKKWRDPKPEDYKPGGFLYDMLKNSSWYNTYKGQVKGGIRAHSLHVHHLFVVKIDGGPITQVEHAEMPSIIKSCKEDLAKLGVMNEVKELHVKYLADLVPMFKAHKNYPYDKIYIVNRQKYDGYPFGVLYMFDTEKNQVVSHNGPIIPKCLSASYNNAIGMAALGGKLYIITGTGRGVTAEHKPSGGGGVYIFNPADPSSATGGKAGGATWDGYADATCMVASRTNEKIYVVTRKSGLVHELDPKTKKVRHVGKGFENANVMTEMDGKLYIATGVMNGAKGDGGLFEIDPKTEKMTQIRKNGTFANATCMTSMDGYIYIITGKMGGCNGGGGLYKQLPIVDKDSATVRKGGFANATAMTAAAGKIYITTGKVDGANGDGGMYSFDPNDVDVDGKKSTEVSKGWAGVLTMAAMGPSYELDNLLKGSATAKKVSGSAVAAARALGA